MREEQFDSDAEGSRVPRRRFLQASALVGAGTVSNVVQAQTQPIAITDWNELVAISEDPSASYVLENDLDASTPGYDEQVGETGENISAIANFEFAGTFDGNGHEIADLRIESDFSDALFGSILQGGVIRDLALTNVEITSEFGAGLVLRNDGEVTNVSISGEVSGDFTGGVAIDNRGRVTGSEFDGTVRGTTAGAGLVNTNRGVVADSTVRGSISGERRVGAIVGFFSPGIVRNSQYNVDELTLNGESAVTAGGLFDQQYRDWEENGRSLQLDDYDSLTASDDQVEISDVQGIRDALGFVQDPEIDWQITDDIDLSGHNPDLYIPYLAGNLDGGGHTVTMDTDLPAVPGVGVIGFNEGGTVSNLAVDGTVRGTVSTGGLVGVQYRQGRVENAATEADIRAGAGPAGGVVGTNTSGTIVDSYAQGSIEQSGAVSNTEPPTVGGLVGRQSIGLLTRSYASGELSGETVGGLVGDVVRPADITQEQEPEAVVRDAYWDGETTGLDQAVGSTQQAEGLTVTREGDVTDLATTEMQGDSARETMSGLDFEETWLTRPDSYPALRALSERVVSEGQTEVTVIDEGDRRRAEISVSDVTAGEAVEIPLDLPVSDGFRLESLSVTADVDGDLEFEIVASREPLASTPVALEVPGENRVFGYFSIREQTIPDDELSDVEIQFAVDQQRFADIGVDPEQMALYRYEEDWVARPTQQQAESEGEIQFRTESPGLSEWSGAAYEPEIVIDNAEVDVTRIQRNEDVDVSVELRNRGEADGVYVTQLLFQEEVVDERRPTVPSGSRISLLFSEAIVEPGEYQVVVNEVTVDTVTVVGDSTDDGSDGTDTTANGDDSPLGEGAVATGVVLGGAAAAWYYLRNDGDSDDQSPPEEPPEPPRE